MLWQNLFRESLLAQLGSKQLTLTPPIYGSLPKTKQNKNLKVSAGTGWCQCTARSPGSWGNRWISGSSGSLQGVFLTQGETYLPPCHHHLEDLPSGTIPGKTPTVSCIGLPSHSPNSRFSPPLRPPVLLDALHSLSMPAHQKHLLLRNGWSAALLLWGRRTFPFIFPGKGFQCSPCSNDTSFRSRIFSP